jgi:hypothetical protein
VEINVVIYIKSRNAVKLFKKMGSGYEHFHPKIDSTPIKAQTKIFSNVGFIVFTHSFNEAIRK